MLSGEYWAKKNKKLTRIQKHRNFVCAGPTNRTKNERLLRHAWQQTKEKKDETYKAPNRQSPCCRSFVYLLPRPVRASFVCRLIRRLRVHVSVLMWVVFHRGLEGQRWVVLLGQDLAGMRRVSTVVLWVTRGRELQVWMTQWVSMGPHNLGSRISSAFTVWDVLMAGTIARWRVGLWGRGWAWMGRVLEMVVMVRMLLLKTEDVLLLVMWVSVGMLRWRLLKSFSLVRVERLWRRRGRKVMCGGHVSLMVMVLVAISGMVMGTGSNRKGVHGVMFVAWRKKTKAMTF